MYSFTMGFKYAQLSLDDVREVAPKFYEHIEKVMEADVLQEDQIVIVMAAPEELDMVAGFIVVSVNGDRNVHARLAVVHNNYRGQGVCRGMIEYLKEQVDQIMLFAGDATIDMWWKLGFTLRSYDRPNDPMEKYIGVWVKDSSVPAVGFKFPDRTLDIVLKPETPSHLSGKERAHIIDSGMEMLAAMGRI